MKRILILVAILGITSINIGSTVITEPIFFDVTKASPNIQLVEYISKYSVEYDIPASYLYNCAKAETGFKGLYHEKYNPYQVSPKLAVGPFQVRSICALDVWGREIPLDSLKTNIHLNVLTAVKYIDKLRTVYKIKDWGRLFTVYNQGFKRKDPYINDYAKKIIGKK